MPGRIIQTLRRIESRNPVICWTNWTRSARIFAAIRGGVAGGARPGAKPHVYRPLPRPALRPFAGALHHTANWLEPIHPALRDRLEVIELPSYTESEKLQIAKRYLVPRQIEEHGLTRRM